MKSLLPAILLFLLTALTLLAQTNVTLNIHHKLGEADFAMETEATNNIGHSFDYTRLQYYIAEISLIHDGGQETLVEDLYMLVNAEEATTQALGELPVTNLEAIRFHIGVDEANNHADPASFGNGHPLAPQFPSMHWGWVSGYRFGAFEGRSGTNMSQFWEIHALEDENYFQTEVALDLSAENGTLTIDLDADYARAMEDIQMNSGPVTHGGFGEAITALRNFQEHVFTASGLVSSNEDILNVGAFQLYPNPTTNRRSSLFIATPSTDVYQLHVTDAQGRLVRQMDQVSSNTEVELTLPAAGVYFVQVRRNGAVLQAKRLVVQ